MTDHAVRVLAANSQESSPSTEPDPSPPDWTPDLLKNRVDQNVFNDLLEVVSEDAITPKTLNTERDGSGTDYIAMVYRVDGSQDESTVLDKFEDNVVIDAEWYEIKHHGDCTHGESDSERSGCGDWNQKRSKGSIPEGAT